MNRLAGASSPYLLQHKDNPVDWWEWGPDAFAEARRLDRPVLLSVGYAACHWCHVMAHESFEDAQVAALMNAEFVNVKVDREERPDVDAVYMSAVQALNSGRGGWPMTVFLTSQGRPFYAGTYFPPRPSHSTPSFPQVLTSISRTWRERRGEVEDAAGQISAALAQQSLPVGPRPPDDAVAAAAVHALGQAEDVEYGGFGGAPKFPPSAVCEFLLRHAARVRGPDGARALAIADNTLQAMARSGMYDQVAGGFARYSVDRAWVVPHFEKMLYDNAQLARVYLHWWRLAGEPTGARIAEETCDWLLAGLRTAEGGFASALDADTPVPGADGHVRGVEGYTYVWSPAQLQEVLGDDDGAWAVELLGVSAEGTFEEGTSTARLLRDVWADPAEAQRWLGVRAQLAERRAVRPQPARDDKVVAAWNGLAIAALAETGALLDRPDFVDAAVRAAELLLAVHLIDPGSGGGARLRRVSRGGVAGAPAGVLEDYGDVAEGLLALHAVTGQARWLAVAGGLLDTVLDQFADGEGGFYDTPLDATDAALATVRRPKDPTDGPHPSGWTAATGSLLGYAALTGSARHREAAEAGLGLVAGIGRRAPQAVGWGLAVAEAHLDGPREVAVVGPDGDPGRAALHAAALRANAPGAVVSVGAPDAAGVPLLAGRALVGGSATAYVCHHFACEAPTTDPDALNRQLAAART